MSRPMPDARLKDIKKRLDSEYSERASLLDYGEAFQLMVAVSLSAQTTDAAVNKVTPEIFRRWGTPERLADAPLNDLEAVVHPLGFFRTKARNLKAASLRLVKEFGGEVPQDLEDLVSLPGIGRKSANVIRAHIWNKPGIIVDTHFGRVCRRLGLSAATDPVKMEREMSELVPEAWQIDFSMTVNLHGRRYCKSRKPDCQSCPLADLCPRVGLGPS